jgi:hypothetical protein
MTPDSQDNGARRNRCCVVTTGEQPVTTDFCGKKYEPINRETVGNDKDIKRGHCWDQLPGNG